MLYNNMMDVGVFLTHFRLCERKHEHPDFTKAWISLFAHGLKTRLAWWTQTQLSALSYSAPRWWRDMHQIHDRFGDVSTSLHGSGLPPAIRLAKLLAIL